MVDQSKSPVEVSNASPLDNGTDHSDNHHKISSTAATDLLKNIDWPFNSPELYKIAFNFFKGTVALMQVSA